MIGILTKYFKAKIILYLIILGIVIILNLLYSYGTQKLKIYNLYPKQTANELNNIYKMNYSIVNLLPK